MKPKDRLYRGEYLIALYDEKTDDELLCVLSNAYEFADMMGMGIKTAKVELSCFFLGKQRTVSYQGDKYIVHFVKISENDD